MSKWYTYYLKQQQQQQRQKQQQLKEFNRLPFNKQLMTVYS